MANQMKTALGALSVMLPKSTQLKIQRQKSKDQSPELKPDAKANSFIDDAGEGSILSQSQNFQNQSIQEWFKKYPHKLEEIDRPEKEPGDPLMKHVHYMKRIHGPINFEKQRSKSKLLNEAVHPLNDTRFETFHDISDYNGKFGKRISQPFPRVTRNTDIPGTVKK